MASPGYSKKFCGTDLLDSSKIFGNDKLLWIFCMSWGFCKIETLNCLYIKNRCPIPSKTHLWMFHILFVRRIKHTGFSQFSQIYDDEVQLEEKTLCIKWISNHIEKNGDESLCTKLLFLAEQLKLCIHDKYARRYSPSLLAMALMWDQRSPGLYSQILDEKVSTLPSSISLSSSFNMETGSTESTKAYLTARAKNLSDLEKNVVLLIDEIHTAPRVEYQNGQLCGLSN